MKLRKQDIFSEPITMHFALIFRPITMSSEGKYQKKLRAQKREEKKQKNQAAEAESPAKLADFFPGIRKKGKGKKQNNNKALQANKRSSVSSASTFEDKQELPIDHVDVSSQMQNDTKMGAEVSGKQVRKPSVKEVNSTSELTSLLTEYEEYDGSIMETESMPLASEKFELEDFVPKKTIPDLIVEDVCQETQAKMEYLPATVTLTDYVIVKGPNPVGLEDNNLPSFNNPGNFFFLQSLVIKMMSAQLLVIQTTVIFWLPKI